MLLTIASAIGKESLNSLMQRLDGARLEEDKVILEPGTASDFHRRQIKENLAVITQAATAAVGNKVSVLLEESSGTPQAPVKPRNRSDNQPEAALLEKAKQEPVVQSFLDVFPGQVKAEKIDP